MNCMNKLIKISLIFLLTFCCISVDAQKKRGASKSKKQTVKPSKKAKSKAKKSASKQPVNVETQPKETLVLSKDTTMPNVVTITSAFKPFLRSAAKINFTASAPELDTNRFLLSYNIPAQNLFFSYQPVPIKPLALTADSSFEWQNHQYVKVGFGNFTTPYFETGLAFGKPSQTLFNINGKFVTSKGSLPFQEFTNAGLKVSAIISSIANHELTASLSYSLANQNKYGVKPNIVFTQDELKQNFNTIEAAIGLHTKTDNSYGISYHPQLKASLFFDNREGKETSILIKAPISKTISNSLKINIEIDGDITSYSSKLISDKISNNIFSVGSTAVYNNKDLKLNIGVMPTWNNQEFKLLPNITAQYNLSSDKLFATAGLLGYYQKNTYKSLAAINPFIDQPTTFLNTKINEIYGGIKAGFGKHFTFNAQLSFLKYANQSLFVNDAVAAKSQNFNILYEPTLKAVKLAAEIGYTVNEKFSFLASTKFTQFTSQESFPKAYGILPLEVSGTVKYRILKDVFLKGDLFFWDGANYRVQTIQSDKTSAAFDLNLGAEYKVLNRLNLYIDFNNLFNNQYQRWNQYNVFGFNIVGGVVYSLH